MQRSEQLSFRHRLGPAGAALGLALAAFCAGSCGDDEPRVCKPLSSECPAQVPSYAQDIAPLIERRCATCHREHESGTMGPWPFHEYQDVVDWDFTIIASLDDCSMPPENSHVEFPEQEREALYAWLMCGSPNN